MLRVALELIGKRGLKWLFTQHAVNSNENFEFFISKLTFFLNRLFLKIFNPKSLPNNFKCYVPHPYIIKNEYGFLALVIDGFTMSVFTRGYETNVLEKIKLKNNSVFVDIGSNLGFYTLFAAKKSPEGFIISIEPDKDLYEKIVKNVKVNNFDNVKCINVAIWDKNDQEIRLYEDIISGHNPTCFGGGEKYSIIKTRTLDSIVSEYGLKKIDWMKIDVETAEVNVLEGAKNSLDITNNLIVEIHSRYNGKKCKEILKNNGFNIQILTKFKDSNKMDDQIFDKMQDETGKFLYYPVILARK